MAGEAVGSAGDAVRVWAREAAQAGMSPATLAGELRSRYGLSLIPAIMVLREATGSSLGDAKGVVGAVPSAEYPAANEELVSDLADSFMADLIVSGAAVRLSWDPRRSRWQLMVTSGSATMARDLDAGSPASLRAIEEAERIIDRLASRRSRVLRASWLDLAEGETRGAVESSEGT